MTTRKVEDAYFTAKNPGAYTGVATFKKTLPPRLRKSGKAWLLDQDVYNLHKQPTRRFKRRPVVTNGHFGDQFQADLLDLSRLSGSNKNVKFILTVVDCATRFGYALPLKNKSAIEVSAALETIFKREAPTRLQTDKGTEFTNARVAALLKKYGVGLFHSENADVKASVVERFNRTLCGRLFKYMTAMDTLVYVDKLPRFVKSYNLTPHAAIGMAPAKVTEANSELVWRLQRDRKKRKKPLPPRFSLGEYVRLAKAPRTFRKGYLTNWTHELFRVDAISPGSPPMYVVSGVDGERIRGKFYAQELVKTRGPKVDEVLDRKRTPRGGYKYLLKFKDAHSNRQQWVERLQLEQFKS